MHTDVDPRGKKCYCPQQKITQQEYLLPLKVLAILLLFYAQNALVAELQLG